MTSGTAQSGPPSDEAAPKPERLAGLRGLVRIVGEHRRRLVIAIATTLSGMLLALAQPLVLRDTIASASSGDVVTAGVFSLIALFVLQAGVEAWGRFQLARTAEAVVVNLRTSLIAHLLRLPVRSYDRYRSGDLIARVGGDTTALRTVVAEGAANAIIGGIGLIGALALMIWVDYVLFTAVLALVAVAAAIMLLLLGRVRAASLAGQEALGSMTADLERALSAIRTVRANQTEAIETARISTHAEHARVAHVGIAKLNAVVSPASKLAIHGAVVAVLLIGGIRAAAGTGSVADLMAFVLYLTYLTMPLGLLFEAVSTIQEGSGALHRVGEVTRIPAESAVGPAHRPSPPAPVHPTRGSRPALEFRHVDFGYDEHRRVLRDVTFSVPARGCTALVGPSGAGKSTAFALAERFYDVHAGTILLDGRDITAADPRTCRSHIRLVEQDTPVLHGTLRENLTYGHAEVRDDDLQWVVSAANLGDVVDRLPDGLDSQVGEHGSRLSGGERQRVAVARALLAGPRLLLLDEPTSHLDSASESALTRTLTEVSADRAVMVIAHRFSTVRAADRVVVLEDGGVMAEGTHNELLETSAYYRDLARDRFAPLV
ncbi:ATP-binding cassette subfamily B protein [Murinocardiopsis flavida]|uniref:ATP-binding cassette subfamily B protein n=1 Tax=Murinocardiopsis flavida TaxID=645275 RepID=A0A2P8CEY1_9ACTN|nr:ABC transporter ATP-binding protein [Murinocardiopsis flavida]PSK83550.1 ATP-binding cassette subfamily B protein [Murinocardiopsis flavida]